MAEGEGFEPPEPFGSMVFKTTAFDRSATLPAICAGNRLLKNEIRSFASKEIHAFRKYPQLSRPADSTIRERDVPTTLPDLRFTFPNVLTPVPKLGF